MTASPCSVVLSKIGLQHMSLKSLNCLGLLQLIHAPVMTRLQLLGRNSRYSRQKYSRDETKWNQYKEPCGWHVPNLQALSIGICKMDTSFFATFSCSKLTELELRSTGLWSRDVKDLVHGCLPSLNQLPRLRKLKLHDFALWEEGSLLEPLSNLTRYIAIR